ncbi:MAG: YncE family protein [Muribaculaceae bacterium]|nr:YncE family protein [Muribaculaceae bacterium]
MKAFYSLFLAASLLMAHSCRTDEIIVIPEGDVIIDFPAEDSEISGFYLVNEGNMGSNKCTLDRFSYATGLYERNIYAAANPDVAMELGDVGNDIAVYGSKLYVVVNCSHKVEVLDRFTARRLAKIDIPNCRYLAFDGPNAYVSSYIGPVGEDPDCPLGAVFRIDTLSLSVTAQCTVGYQPEEMLVRDGKLYVANSGGYRPPVYDRTVSVIDLPSFREERKIDVAINLHHLRADSKGRLWVSSRGNREGSIPSALYMLCPDAQGNMELARSFPDVPVSNMAIHGDRLYYFHASKAGQAEYGILNLNDLAPEARSFVAPEVQADIRMPYGLAVHPETGDIFITDARNYVSSGYLHCLSPDGSEKWKMRTGDIPARIAFTKK